MDSLMLVSNVVLWIAVLVLGLLVYALTRQVGHLYQRVAPAGALLVNQALNVGDQAPTMTVETLGGTRVDIGTGGRDQLLVFLAPDCPICASLLPVVKSVQRAEGAIDVVLASDGGAREEHETFIAEHDLQGYPYVLSEPLGRNYGVSKLPYAVLIDAEARIAAMGIVNSREHLESLFEAQERDVGSIQEYMAGREPRFRDATKPPPASRS